MSIENSIIQEQSSSTISNDGIEIFFDTYQSSKSPSRNEWVTLVNGHTRSASDFKLLARKLSSLGFSCLCIDNRASGRSQTKKEFEFSQFRKDIVRCWDALTIQSSHILGISMGGLICIDLCIHEAKRINRTIIASSFYKNLSDGKRSIPWGNTIQSVTDKLKLYFAPKFYENNQYLFNSMAKQILTKIENGSFNENASLQRNAIKNVDFTDNLKSITNPTLLIHGSDDQVLDAANSIEMHQKIPDSELKLYEGVGHLILAERPEEFFKDIVAFLKN